MDPPGALPGREQDGPPVAIIQVMRLGMAHSSEIEKLERRWMDNPTGLTFAPLAEAYRRAGDHPRALEVLELGLAQHPAYVPALIVRARCHLDAHLGGEAETSFHAVLHSDPHNLIALKGLADICESSGRLPGALEFLDRMLEADPTHTEAADQRGRVLGLMAERESALAAPAESGTQLDPPAPDGSATVETLEVTAEVDPGLELVSRMDLSLEVEPAAEFEPTAVVDASPADSDRVGAESPAAVDPVDPGTNPFEGFDASTWDLPFAEVKLPDQPFEEHVSPEALPESPALLDGEPTVEVAASEAGTPDAELPVVLEDEEVPAPLVSVDTAPGAPVEWNPASWGMEQEEAKPADTAAEPETEAASVEPSDEAPEVVTGDPVSESASVEAAVEDRAPEVPLETVATSAESAGEGSGAGPGRADEATQEIVSEVTAPVEGSVPGRSLYLGSVHEPQGSREVQGGSESPENPTEAEAEAAMVMAAAVEPSPEPEEEPVRDLRLEGETYAEIEDGWVPSTDWSTPEEVPTAGFGMEQPEMSPAADAETAVTVEEPDAIEPEATPVIAEVEASGEPVEEPPPVMVEMAEDTALAEGKAGEVEEASVGEPVVTASGETGEVEPVSAVAEEPEEAVSVVEGAFEEEPAAPDSEPEIEPELVITETMAEVFLRQGHRALALAVYAQLLEQDPGSQRLQDASARLRGELLGARAAEAPTAVSEPEEPIGSFLARVLGPEMIVEDASAPPAPSGPLSGRPTRPAEDPSLSLSTIFGEDSRRRSAVASGAEDLTQDAEPSFDEFFGATGVPAGAGGDEAELEQFNAWLRSLQR